ncbi:MAG TPA: MBL fold metallo-hydrolase [Bacteroidia bacterium]|nr:MBL fold metallo-hydrolase [Bacteroidia bacterium]
MLIEQIYTGCLAQGAYYIRAGLEAVIVDPMRDVKPYIDRAKQDGVKIKYIFETHFHADFVSGHVELAQKTGAEIVYGPLANPAFKARIAKDGEIFQVGDVTFELLHTPGHTLESSCYLLRDQHGEEKALFSGDTLFLGDVGRPDLAQKAASLTQEELAGMLYDSLQHKIMPLPDAVVVYPAHGAGSACGKNMMRETSDSLGHQKVMNYALNQKDKQAFIQAVTEGLTAPPAYFPHNVRLNKMGYASMDSVLLSGLKALGADEFEHTAKRLDALVIDTRDANDFSKGFIPGSINIGLKGDFAPWLGAIIGDVNRNILLVTEPGTEEEGLTRMSRVGFDHVAGYLMGSYKTWLDSGKHSDRVIRIDAGQFEKELNPKHDLVIDVRKPSEYQSEHLEMAVNRPLLDINSWLATIPLTGEFYLHCAGGYRSMIAASLLKARGVHNFKEVEGGYKTIGMTTLPKSTQSCSI